MKLFFTIFAAILAAAAVIFGLFSWKQNVDVTARARVIRNCERSAEVVSESAKTGVISERQLSDIYMTVLDASMQIKNGRITAVHKEHVMELIISARGAMAVGKECNSLSKMAWKEEDFLKMLVDLKKTAASW